MTFPVRKSQVRLGPTDFSTDVVHAPRKTRRRTSGICPRLHCRLKSNSATTTVAIRFVLAEIKIRFEFRAHLNRRAAKGPAQIALRRHCRARPGLWKAVPRLQDFELAAGDNFPKANSRTSGLKILIVLVNLTAAFRAGTFKVPNSPGTVSLSWRLASHDLPLIWAISFHEIRALHLPRAMLSSLNSHKRSDRAKKAPRIHTRAKVFANEKALAVGCNSRPCRKTYFRTSGFDGWRSRGRRWAPRRPFRASLHAILRRR